MPVTQYGIMPQNIATDVNLSTSIKQWLFQQVKLPYDSLAPTLGLTLGYVSQADGSWTTDNAGVYIFEGKGSNDPRLYERLPCVMYLVDDNRATKSPRSTGCGDGAEWEYIAVQLICVPAPFVQSDGSAEYDPMSRSTLKTLFRNAVTRTYILPIVDRSQGASGNPALYPQTSVARLYEQRIKEIPNELKSMMVKDRGRFDVEFVIEWPVVTTNG